MEEVYPRQPIGETEDSLGPISDISPDFSQFEPELSPEEKQAAYAEFAAAQRLRDNVGRYIRRPLKIAGVLLGLSAVIFGIWYLISCRPSNLEFTIPAIEYRQNEPESEMSTTITIKGKLYRRPFDDPQFIGIVDVASRIDSDWKYHHNFDISYKIREAGTMEGYLTYIVHEKSEWDSALKGIAIMNCDLSMNRFALSVWEPADNTGSGDTIKDLRICAPAANREEAENLTRELIERPWARYLEQWEDAAPSSIITTSKLVVCTGPGRAKYELSP